MLMLLLFWDFCAVKLIFEWTSSFLGPAATLELVFASFEAYFSPDIEIVPDLMDYVQTFRCFIAF